MATKQIYTSDDLIASVRDAITLPNSQAIGTDDTRILKYLNQALLAQIVPEIVKLREEYYVTSYRIPLVASTSRYRLPTRAFLNKLRGIYYVASSGQLRYLPAISPDERHLFPSAGVPAPSGYYLEGNDVVLIPSVGTSIEGQLELSFFFRPSDLVLTNDARQVLTVTTLTVTLAGTAFPTGWNVSSKLDVHSADSGGETRIWDAALVTPFTWPTLVFAVPIDGGVLGTKAVAVGDWVCLAGEAVIPAIPKEYHPLLIEAAALRILKALGDQPNIQSQAGMLKAGLSGMAEATESRVEGRPLRIHGRRGLLRQGRW